MPAAHVEILSVVGFVALWVGIVWLVSFFSGWRVLAAAYPCVRTFPSAAWRFRTLGMRWANYGCCVTLGADATDLCVRVLWIFRPGHAAFCVPWQDVRVEEQERTFMGLLPFRCAVFTLAREPHVELLVAPKLAREILDHPDVRGASPTVKWLEDDAQT